MTTAVYTEYFRTAPVLPDQASEWKGPDRNRNIIFGAKLIQAGRLNDYEARPWEVDETTLQQTLEHGSKRNKGLKARFSHPNMSDDGLGSFVGYWKDLRIVGDAVYGDLYLADSAFDTPKGDLATYLLDRAEEDPDSFGVSLATKLGDEMNQGNERDEETGEYLPLPLRFADVRAADFVDEPAATRGGLFDSVDFGDVRDLPRALDWIIDHHFSDYSAADLLDKARRYLSKRFKEPLPMTTENTPPVDEPKPADELSQNTPPAAEPEPAAAPTTTPEAEGFSQSEIERYREAFGHELGANLLCDGLSFDEAAQFHRDMLQTRIDDLEKENAELKEQLCAVMGEKEPVPTGAPEGEENGTTILQQIRHK